MENAGKLRRVEDRLIKDLKKTTIPLWRLGKKYGVSKQAIFQFMRRKEIKRPNKDHTKECSICKALIRMAKKPHSDFISSHTIREQLKVGSIISHHIGILRKEGLISQKFGRLRSKRAELAYQIYFKKRLPVSTIGRQVGLKNFHSVIEKHRVLGWDVPAPLFEYDGNDRRAFRLKVLKKKRRG
jgi:hypothetical protein